MEKQGLVSFDVEVRQGYTVTSEMKRMWACQLTLLQKLLEVCAKHNLKVWADGGTLLGAVRHHGYIPWDDDIDMVMLRDDYDKLLAVAKSEFVSPFFFQCTYTDRNYYRGHSQLRYDGTTAILPADVNQKFHQGIFIDIFVYDKVPEVRGVMWKSALFCVETISKILRKANYGKTSLNSPRSFFIYLVSATVCLLVGGKNLFSLEEKIVKLLSRRPTSKVSCPMFTRDERILSRVIRDVCWYSDTLFFAFENIMLPIPVGYDAILTMQYGDYMVPCKAPSFHGSFLYIDVNKNYSEYLKN